MLLFLFLLIGTPLLMMVVGMYRMLAWARVVKTWHKSFGTVVGYYMRTGRWGTVERLSFAQVTAIEARHRRSRYHTYDTEQHFFSAIIQYQYGYQMQEMVQEIRLDETLPYAPNEELLVYINPKNATQVKLGDNINQLWLPFTIFAVGLAWSIGIVTWGVQHSWSIS